MDGGQCGRNEHSRFGLFLETGLTVTHFGGVEISGNVVTRLLYQHDRVY